MGKLRGLGLRWTSRSRRQGKHSSHEKAQKHKGSKDKSKMGPRNDHDNNWRTAVLLGLAILMGALSQGCAKKESQSTTVKSNRAGRSNYADAKSYGSQAPCRTGRASAPQGKTWSSMTRGNMSAQDFATSVQMFVSATLPPDQLGYVGSSANESTGICFWGSVATTIPISYTSTYNYAQVRSNSILHLSIWDSYAGKVNSDNQLIPEYGADYQGYAYGQIYGSYAEIHFEDAYGYGSVTLRGDILGATFSGYLSFQNNQYWDGAAPGAGGDDVWAFSVPTCSFFSCQ